MGTALLVVFGMVWSPNVVLAMTKGNSAGWIVIIAGWGLAVFVGAFCSAPFSGADLNPAVTVAVAAAGKLPVVLAPGSCLSGLSVGPQSSWLRKPTVAYSTTS